MPKNKDVSPMPEEIETNPAELDSDMAPETEVADLLLELEKSACALSELNDRYLRVLAEYDNFRKRSRAEREKLYADAVCETLGTILPIYDNLERAVLIQTEDKEYARGVELTFEQFAVSFEKLGVREIPALGQPFDPALHNAVLHAEDETKGEAEIVEVFQKGFLLGERVIRHAVVKVVN